MKHFKELQLIITIKYNVLIMYCVIYLENVFMFDFFLRSHVKTK